MQYDVIETGYEADRETIETFEGLWEELNDGDEQ